MLEITWSILELIAAIKSVDWAQVAQVPAQKPCQLWRYVVEFTGTYVSVNCWQLLAPFRSFSLSCCLRHLVTQLALTFFLHLFELFIDASAREHESTGKSGHGDWKHAAYEINEQINVMLLYFKKYHVYHICISPWNQLAWYECHSHPSQTDCKRTCKIITVKWNPQICRLHNKKRFRYFLGRFRFIRTLGCQFFFVCLLWYSPDTKLCAFEQRIGSGPIAVGQNIAAKVYFPWMWTASTTQGSEHYSILYHILPTAAKAGMSQCLQGWPLVRPSVPGLSDGWSPSFPPNVQSPEGAQVELSSGNIFCKWSHHVSTCFTH